MNSGGPIMIMAGGTGGHVYPALAVAEYLRARGVSLFWLGTTRGIENRVVPQQGIELLTVRVSGVRGKGLQSKLAAPVKILAAIFQALYICIRRRPAAALGMGGFASGPGGVAAWLLRIPLLIHEQNRVAGTTNRILARFAVKIMQGFPGTFEARAGAVTTGNPVRRQIVDLASRKSSETKSRPASDTISDWMPEQVRHDEEGPKSRGQSKITPARAGGPDNEDFTLTPASVNILILGGSQGARKLNRVAPLALDRLQRRMKLNVRHQCGERHLAETQRVYDGLQLDQVRLDPFIDDMASAYEWADIAVCRAGALTIAELCAAGLAAILVPFPYAIDDHQTANARFLRDAGAALLLPEDELTETGLEDLLWQLFSTEDRLSELARNSRSCAFPDAAQAVGALCLEHAYA
ncbi:MAG: undecaprenyldiphospho-muramoylpentapeptide beta-N-acetylglucosaminyltransferase [Gammaproteobacteria bacterium]|nr:undecaprenyldiphospho-muramoylpentapeptide beta-N-acetylglucosaminyltransferase [Gammaproteobacteria bacterium]MDE0510616.1 undecaprenyldiphospho-muramoylpentapeptide beta-N-acetylglucosaminyltransferase [Gammaproteobacteria bacterium]